MYTSLAPLLVVSQYILVHTNTNLTITTSYKLQSLSRFRRIKSSILSSSEFQKHEVKIRVAVFFASVLFRVCLHTRQADCSGREIDLAAILYVIHTGATFTFSSATETETKENERKTN